MIELIPVSYMKVRLNGTKAWITNAKQGEAVCVFASADRSKRHKGTSHP